MNNVRGLYPPLYGATPSGGGGGGGGGQHIQVDTLPDASLANKDKILQYVGATTETLTNAYFYKCVENTGYDWEETEASETYTEAETLPTASAETIGTIYKVGEKYYQTIIVLSYSWDNVDVMEAPTPPSPFGSFKSMEINVTTTANLNTSPDIMDFTGKTLIGFIGSIYREGQGYGWYVHGLCYKLTNNFSWNIYQQGDKLKANTQQANAFPSGCVIRGIAIYLDN